MRKRTILAAAAATVMASLGFAVPASAAPTSGKYVALGDSYASGLGSGPVTSGPCKQSKKGYPHLWAALKGNNLTLTNKSCTGATIKDVHNKQLGTSGTPDKSVKLVTITAGGNDVGFVPTAEKCFLGTDQDCIEASFGSAWSGRLVVPGYLTDLLGATEKRYPNAEIIVLGYPRLLDEGTRSCGVVNPSAVKREWMNYAANETAEGMKGATEKAGHKFVDMRAAFAKNAACSATPFINNVSLATGTGGELAASRESLHPNEKGQVAYVWMLAAA